MLKNVFSLRVFSLFVLTAVIVPVFSSFVQPGSGLVNEVLSSTNEFRRSKGKSGLVMRDDLNTIARKHSENMAKGKVGFGHSGFDQRHNQVKQIFQSCTMAENVAYGASNGKEAVNIWKKSSGHRANMLGNYKYIGIGTAKDKLGTIYYTQIFVR